MQKHELDQLRANQYFLVQELQRRSVRVTALDLENELIEAALGSHVEHLLNIDSSLMNYPASVITGDKRIAKKLLQRAGISVPQGGAFAAGEREKARALALELGFPLVLKPAFGVQGQDVYTHIEYLSELEEIAEALLNRRGDIPLILEEQFEAKEYRIFITQNRDYAVIHRDPAHVIGDGSLTIGELIAAENVRRTSPRTNCLCPIQIDELAVNFLRKQGKDLTYVPASAEKVYLRGNSNAKTGGMCEDATDCVDPSVIDIAARCLAVFPRMPYAGIDLMTADASRLQDADSYRVIEINSLPGIGMHLAPGKGKPRNVAKFIVDLIFPETAGHGAGR